MTLSEREKALLDDIGAHIRRDDPELARRLSGLAPSTAGGWRPPKAAVAVALVLVAGASALVGGVTLAMSRQCPAATAPADRTRTVSSSPVPAVTVPPGSAPPGGARNC